MNEAERQARRDAARDKRRATFASKVKRLLHPKGAVAKELFGAMRCAASTGRRPFTRRERTS